MKKTSVFLGSALLLGAILPAGASAMMFTDWSLVDIVTNVADGELGGVKVSFSGSNIDQGITVNSFTGFNSLLFTPPLVNSDFVGFRGAPAGYNYVLTFSAPVEDPIFHFYSLASNLTFSTSHITRLSGDLDFIVDGNVLSGILNDNPNGYDANGTIQLEGSYMTISFTATYFDSREDGIVMQLGSPVPVPATILLFGTGLAGLAGSRLRRKKK